MSTNPAISLFLALALLVLAARLAGTLARQLRQPRVLGELIVGVILGPSLINLLASEPLGFGGAHLEEVVHEFAELGVLLLMFNIGLDIHLKELARVRRVATLSGVAGALLPVALTVPVVLVFGFNWQQALFAGVTLAATSVSISAQVMLELNALRTKLGSALLATALIDDVLAILLVSLTVAITGPTQQIDLTALLLIILRMAAYLTVAFAFAWLLLPRLLNRLHHSPEWAHAYGTPALALVAALIFGWSAEVLGGVAAITGAFIAGVGLSRTREAVKREIHVATNNLAYAFLVPIFFVSIGLEIDLHLFPLSGIPLAAALLAVAIVSKVIGSAWGARAGGFTNQEAFQLGVSMISRGEVGLIIAALGLNSGVFTAEGRLFSALFLVILLTTILTPILVRRVLRGPRPEPEPTAAEAH